ncbi:MAG TPA: hypothetical protein VEL51_16415, partial [Vicinamibacterales bacterium]|nr:hypothetical protein [Vicinamibacterales bacterium]
ELAHKRVARIARLTVARVEVALTPVVAIASVVGARIIEHKTLLERPHIAACSQFWRLLSDNRHDLHHLGVVSL